jgi:hypothetical protein
MSGSCDAPARTDTGRPRLPGGGAGAPGARSEHPHPNQVTPPVIRCRLGASLLRRPAGQNHAYEQHWLPMAAQSRSRRAVPASRGSPAACRAARPQGQARTTRRAP